MAKFAGKYELVKQDNFVEHLQAIGVPQDRIANEAKLNQILTITVDGKNITITNQSFSVDLILNEAVEKKFEKKTTQMVAKLEGENLVVETSGDDLSKSTKVHSISGSELVVKYTNGKAGVPDATRYYKRL